ncbi:hypothetical protein QGX11_gp044 [Pseudomonas phage PPSC2]|uniref:Uncharacterized protein n=1 Tax=Pseudomonas phage PPSC2 TaxID=2041350 RepID=A0A2R2YAQ7_9CAUD|nr:hypothetical protein QGX11_gp044 [Pseudomonas phage PPSC2]ATN92807.1 hypothetical protein PPSC2_44 [Pseudomonas phage PPSC2]
MSKFKIGQRVVVARDESGGADTELLGETGVIDAIYEHGENYTSYSVKIDPEFELSHSYDGLHFEETELEKI